MTESAPPLVFEGVEYVSYPPPREVVKLTQRVWAEQMVAMGTIRFGGLAFYRAWENTVLGDPEDGEGILTVDGHAYTTGSSNPIFAWCSSMPSVSRERLRILAQHGDYDCCVRVLDLAAFIARVKGALVGRKLWLHCGEVAYNKREEVSIGMLNSQRFHFNVFQKNGSFAEDREYRLALTDLSCSYAEVDDVKLTLGPCADILRIEALPQCPVVSR